MDCYKVTGGKPLSGIVYVQGSKNAVLPILTSSLLGKGKIVIQNCPQITDVYNCLKILRNFGVKINKEENGLVLYPEHAKSSKVIREAGQMRSSILFLGSMIGRFGKACIAHPGGCRIGSRPIQYHIEALQKLGVSFTEKSGVIYAKGKLKSGRIHLPYPSVGVTQNLILAAVGSRCVLVIENCAKEPEVRYLAEFLNARGARVTGAGSSQIAIFPPVTEKGILGSCEYQIPGDRIVAGTYAAAVCAVGGAIAMKGVACADLAAFLAHIERRGADVFCNQDVLYVECKKRLHAGDFATAPFPGFPTDLQPVMAVVDAVSDGVSQVKENIFENRFTYVPALGKMQADMRLEEDRKLIVKGKEELYAADIQTTDLRQGAALVIAGLVAKGTTIVYDEGYIKRGYEDICRDLQALGASICMESAGKV